MNNISLKSLFIILYVFSTALCAAELNNIKVFNPNDYNNVINQQNNKPFIMLFWSVDCSPCLKEMHHISRLTKENRNKFIFISTDGHEMTSDINNVLFKLDLEKEKNWVFNSDFTEHIISTVDKSWYGETPRSYYFDKDKKRTLVANQ